MTLPKVCNTECTCVIWRHNFTVGQKYLRSLATEIWQLLIKRQENKKLSFSNKQKFLNLQFNWWFVNLLILLLNIIQTKAKKRLLNKNYNRGSFIQQLVIAVSTVVVYKYMLVLATQWTPNCSQCFELCFTHYSNFSSIGSPAQAQTEIH